MGRRLTDDEMDELANLMREPLRALVSEKVDGGDDFEKDNRAFAMCMALGECVAAMMAFLVTNNNWTQEHAFECVHDHIETCFNGSLSMIADIQRNGGGLN